MAQRPPHHRLSLRVLGRVQGVGFRPFVARLAGKLGVGGFVRNDGGSVTVAVEGPREVLERFCAALRDEAPPHAQIEAIERREVPVEGAGSFEIRPSAAGDRSLPTVLPDLASCPDCLREIGDPTDRRFGYAFTTCTNCGPRYTVLESLPYDRAHTSMRRFEMCQACRAEYQDPRDRRFHSQTNACPDCGPTLTLRDRAGATLGTGRDALVEAAAALRAGRIVALKGLGGYQLLVDAQNDAAVWALRARKGRPSKPLAVMVANLEAARALCEVCEGAAALLTGAAAPIVLLPVSDPKRLAAGIAPGLWEWGLMLPPTPLHHLLMAAVGRPVVCTSGNRSGEPICTEEAEARAALGAVVDLSLDHDRPIVRHADDSVMRWVVGAPQVIRLARGLAPLPIDLPSAIPELWAAGGHLKAAVAVGRGRRVALGPHVGTLSSPRSLVAWRETRAAMLALHRVQPTRVAHDAHAGYASTAEALAWQREGGLARVAVQHHAAHVYAVMAEHGLEGPLLGFAWDGTGAGPDGTVWGGETLRVESGAWRREASLRLFGLPGGEAAIHEPRRCGLGLWRAMAASEPLPCEPLPREPLPREPLPDTIRGAFLDTDLRVLEALLSRGVRAPMTSSVGRLFDGVAALLGLCQRASFEGEAAMLLEGAARLEGAALLEPARDSGREVAVAGLPMVPGDACDEWAPRWRLDWAPLVAALVADRRDGVSVAALARRFHAALVQTIVAVAKAADVERVVLSGGCFQNRRLLSGAVAGLRAAGFEAYWPQRIPAGDGGLAVGQIWRAAEMMATGERR